MRRGLRFRRIGLIGLILLSPALLLALLIAAVVDIFVLTVRVIAFVLASVGRALAEVSTLIARSF